MPVNEVLGTPLPLPSDDDRWLAAAARLGERGRPVSAPNPAVGAILVKDGRVVGRGWTNSGGRPHAEAAAIKQAGDAARGAALYTSLEPCAHISQRGPTCSKLIAEAGIARVIIGTSDPDPRTAGQGIAMLQEAGIGVSVQECLAAKAKLTGYLQRTTSGRPAITLKLALSLDGKIALSDGSSQWITGDIARRHVHVQRARHDAILVGGETMRQDSPSLTVRLPGYDGPQPSRWVLTRGAAPEGWSAIGNPAEISTMADAQYLYVEGGAGTAAAFLKADLVDVLHIYRAPIILGEGKSAVSDIGLASLEDTHGRWSLQDRRQLGSDLFEAYERS